MRLVSNKTIRQLQEGDVEAFEKIFNAYRDIIYFECYKRIRNTNDVNDCVQEIFLKLLNNIQSYNPDIAEFNAWFRRLYLNHISDFCKKLKTYNYKIIKIDYEDIIEYPIEDVYESDNELIDKIIDLIGEEAYTILMYKYKYQLSIRLIAKELNMNYYQVRKIIKNTIKHLHKIQTKEI